ncbi:putative N(2)N(2)-dimethylguanosine tRNA methyltransferase, partial [Trifolium medium]|nr:putative N(2)N(2)-dimethylguanosine tRNA methyltransferase [Trifolium medium]
VNNRDLSIAVLRAFISKRKQEHEAHLLKIANRAKKASENDSSESAVEEVDNKTPPEDHKTNGKFESVEETSPEESCTTMEGSVKIDEECDADEEKIDQSEVKGPKELKPPTVLEVLIAPLDVLL